MKNMLVLGKYETNEKTLLGITTVTLPNFKATMTVYIYYYLEQILLLTVSRFYCRLEAVTRASKVTHWGIDSSLETFRYMLASKQHTKRINKNRLAKQVINYLWLCYSLAHTMPSNVLHYQINSGCKIANGTQLKFYKTRWNSTTKVSTFLYGSKKPSCTPKTWSCMHFSDRNKISMSC